MSEELSTCGPYVVRTFNDNGYFICEKPLEAHTRAEAFREAANYGRGWARKTTVHVARTGEEVTPASCGFCHDQPVRNAACWYDASAPSTAACPRCGVKRELSTLDRLRAEADDLGMTPEEAGRYVEEALDALDAEAELAEARHLESES